MNGVRLVAILLVVGGVIALIYGGFNYPKSHEAKLGPVAFDVKTQEHVNVPVWAGAGLVVLGVVLLLAPLKKR